MTRFTARLHRPGALAAVAFLLAVLEAGGDPVRHALRYEREGLAAGELWRALTAHLVHLGPRHLVPNLAGLALLWFLYARDARPREWLAVALVAAVAVSAGLWLGAPEVGWYVGASGVLHGLWAAAALANVRRRPLEAGVAGLLLAGKLALEAWRGPAAAPFGGALPVVEVAHLYGAVGGALAALVLALPRRSL